MLVNGQRQSAFDDIDGKSTWRSPLAGHHTTGLLHGLRLDWRSRCASRRRACLSTHIKPCVCWAQQMAGSCMESGYQSAHRIASQTQRFLDADLSSIFHLFRRAAHDCGKVRPPPSNIRPSRLRPGQPTSAPEIEALRRTGIRWHRCQQKRDHACSLARSTKMPVIVKHGGMMPAEPLVGAVTMRPPGILLRDGQGKEEIHPCGVGRP